MVYTVSHQKCMPCLVRFARYSAVTLHGFHESPLSDGRPKPGGLKRTGGESN